MKYLPQGLQILAQKITQRLPAENKLPFFTLSFTLATLIITIVAVQQQQTLIQEAAEICPTETASDTTQVDTTDESTTSPRRTAEEREATRAARQEERTGRSVTSVVTGTSDVNVTTIRTTEAPTIIIGAQGQVVRQNQKKKERVKGQIVVKYKAGKSKRSVDEKVRKRKGKVKKRNQKLRLDIFQVTPENEASLLQELSQDPNIEYAVQDVALSGFARPNDPKFAEQFYLENTGQSILGTAGKPGADIKALPAWEVSQGNGVKIAILDTGIDLSHPELKSKVVASKDFTGKGNVSDGAGHGTFIAGIISAQTNNNEGISGVCPNCQLLVGKVLDDNANVTSIEPVAAGVDWAIENGAKIINISFGQEQPSLALEDVFKQAADKGVLIVASAGNCGGNDFKEHGCTSKNPRTYPASYDFVFSVASTDNKDQIASSSESGSWVDIAAPGYGIYTTAPLQEYSLGGSKKYSYVEGTSFASPMVAGLAGLILSKNPGMSGQQLRQEIEKNADKIQGTNSLWANGRVNAARTVGGETTQPTQTNTDNTAPTNSTTDESSTNNDSNNEGGNTPKPTREKTKKPCKPAKNKDKKANKPTKTPKSEKNTGGSNPLTAVCNQFPNIPGCNGRQKKNKDCTTNPSQASNTRNSGGAGRDGQSTTSQREGTVTTGRINTDETTNTRITVNGREISSGDTGNGGNNFQDGQDINTGGQVGGNQRTEINIDRGGGIQRADQSGGNNNQQSNSSGDCPEQGGNNNTKKATRNASGNSSGSLLCRYAPFLRRCSKEKDDKKKKEEEKKAKEKKDKEEKTKKDKEAQDKKKKDEENKKKK